MSDNTWHPKYQVRVFFKKIGPDPLTTVRGLSSVSEIYFHILKKRLHCIGICRKNEFELFRVYPGDVIRLLRKLGVPDEYVTIA